MVIRTFAPKWWPSVLFALIFFSVGWMLLPYLGLQIDEALYAMPHFQDATYALTIRGHQLPLMLLQYVGTLKTWLYYPILSFLKPTYLTVTVPVLFLGACTIWMFVSLLDTIHGRRAAWFGGLLLATDTSLLLTTCFDWGPVVLQHLLLVTSLVALLKFVRLGTQSALFPGCFLLGLGVWDKVLFLWILGGLIVGLSCVFHREVWMRLTFRNTALAAAGFCLGALPLLIYNAATGFATFRSGAGFGWDEFGQKAVQLRYAWDGRVFFTVLTGPLSEEHALEPQNKLERVSSDLRSTLGEHDSRIGTTYRVSLTTGEEGVAETEICAGRESFIVALGKEGASQKGIFDIFKQLESSSNAELCLQGDLRWTPSFGQKFGSP
jgi:hypothetical protein